MRILKKAPRKGQFWDLQCRLRRSQSVNIQVISCCELGFQVDRLFSPVRPTWMGQNAGGCSWQLTQEPVPLQELVVVHHEPCHFHPHKGARDSLRQEWEQLCRQVEQGKYPEDVSVHLWALVGPNQELKIYHPPSDLLLSPFDSPPKGLSEEAD